MAVPAAGGAPVATLSLRELAGNREDIVAMQAVFGAAPGYFTAIQNAPAGPDEGSGLFTELPPGRSRADKLVFGLYADELAIGCADIVRGWNAPNKAIIGLLLLAESWQGRGLGRDFAARIEQAIHRWPEVDVVRLGVVATNVRALHFWHNLGYRETGERTRNPAFIAEVVVFEKTLFR